MRLLRSGTAQVLLATLVSYVSAFAISKVVAVGMGPDGIALAGAVAGSSSIAASIAILGQQNAIPVWAANHPDDFPGRTVGLAARVTGGMLPFALVPVLAVSVVSLAEYGAPAVVALGISLATVGQAGALLAVSLLSTFRGPAALLRQATVAGLVSAAFTCAALLLLGPTWLPLSIGLGLLVGQVAAIAPHLARWSHRPTLAASEVRAYALSGIGSFPGVLVNSVVIGGLPLLVLTLTSGATAGLFRSAWTLSTVLLALSYAMLRALYLPESSRIVANAAEPDRLHRSVSARLVLIVGVGSIAVCVVAPALLTVLYAPEFASASSALAALTLLSSARAGLYLNQFWLNANGRGRDFSTIEGVFVGFLLVGVVLGSRIGTPLAVSIGCVLAGLVALGASELMLRMRSMRHPLARLPWWGWVLVATQIALVCWICIAAPSRTLLQ